MTRSTATPSHSSSGPNKVIEDYLNAQANNELLRFITCGSVDDGKSTLIGRMLYEAKCLFEDQVSALQHESMQFGTQSGDLDFALLVDGLAAEREQGITIDVAYRFFKTDRRTFIVADTPGHEQYTRNMVTGASTADAAILLIDARQGVLPQTRRHAYIVSILGVQSVIVTINKMDLVNYDQGRFNEIANEINTLISQLKIIRSNVIPVSALRGDNVVQRSELTPWYTGPTLIKTLEQAPTKASRVQAPARMPVQWVNRPHLDFRGVSGTLCSGVMEVGQEVIALPSGQKAKISRIVSHCAEQNQAIADQAITLVFDREIDASRGELICAVDARCEVADHFSARLVWMHNSSGLCGRKVILKIGTNSVNATLTAIKCVIDIESYQERPATALMLNEIARVHIKLDRPLPFTPYDEDQTLGGFILIDKINFATLAAGMIEHPLRRSTNVHYHPHSIGTEDRQALMGHAGAIIWLTGLSGSGKSTIADHLERLLYQNGVHTYLLDGDNVRHGLNCDLGFTPEDRVENIRRIAEVSKLMADAGIVVITAFISPYRADRDAARQRVQPHRFFEVYVNTPLEVAEGRDPKGLYKKARAGEIPNFTGIGSPYEPPARPEVTINTQDQSPEESAAQLFQVVEREILSK